MLEEVQPVLAVSNVGRAIEFYVGRLGFDVVFQVAHHPQYAVIRRDRVCVHLQWHDPSEWGSGDRPMLRFVTSDIDALYDEYAPKGVFHSGTRLQLTPWGTREFAFYDLDRNGLTFYVDVEPSEQ